MKHLSKLVFLLLLIIGSSNCYSKKTTKSIEQEAQDWINLDLNYEENFEENGFYYMVGFYCPPNKSPIIEGKRIIDEKNKHTLNYNPNFDYNCYENIFFDLINDSLDFSQKNYDISQLKNKEKMIKKLEIELAHLIKRYSNITNFKIFKNTELPSDDLYMYFNGILETKKLNLSLIYLDYIENNIDGAEKLNNEINISKHLFANFSTIEGKYLALKLLEIDSIFINKLISIDSPFFEQFFKSTLENLSIIDSSWDDIYIRQFKNQIELLNKISKKKNSKNGKNIISKSYIAFVNSHYNSNKYLINVSKMSSYQFNNALKLIPSFEPSKFEIILDPLKRFYQNNDFLIEIRLSTLAYKHYLTGFSTLINLKYLIRKSQITDDNIDEFITKKSELFNNPFTSKSVKYDKESSVIYFDGPFTDSYDYLSKLNL